MVQSHGTHVGPYVTHMCCTCVTQLNYFVTYVLLLEAGKQTDRRVFHLQSLIEGALHREEGDMEMSQTVSLHNLIINGQRADRPILTLLCLCHRMSFLAPKIEGPMAFSQHS